MAIMDNLEVLGRVVSEKGKEAAKKAREITEALQLKAQITAEKNMIQEIYMKIGERYYEEHKAKPGEDFEDLFEEIARSLDKLAGLEQELCVVERIRTCEACGGKVSEEASFCCNCGSRIEPKPQSGSCDDEAAGAEKKAEAEFEDDEF